MVQCGAHRHGRRAIAAASAPPSLNGGTSIAGTDLSGTTRVVFGAGNADADLMFVGEAPGFHEDRQGVPFVGPSGQLLNSFIDLNNLALSRFSAEDRKRIVDSANELNRLRQDAVGVHQDGTGVAAPSERGTNWPCPGWVLISPRS